MPECPFCKETVGANDFLPTGQTVCTVCGKQVLSLSSAEPWWVSAAAAQPIEMKAAALESPPEPWWTPSAAPEPPETPVPPAAPEPSAPVAVPESMSSPPPPPPRTVTSTRRVPPRAASVDDDDEEPLSLLDRLRDLNFGAALGFLCFSAALLLNSFDALELYIKPVAGLGLLAALLGGTVPAFRQRRSVVLPVLLSVSCLLVLVFLGSWPTSSSPTPQLLTVPLRPDGMSAHQATSEDDWVDASANAVKRGDVRVQIVSAEIGPVSLKGKAAAVSSSERYLALGVRVSYEGIIFQQTPYEPWTDRTDAPSQHPPTLTDNQGRSYTQTTFDPGWKVVGRADVDALNPGHQVKDVLVYPVPARDVEHLRLLLPASAFGQPGEFRFRIPRSMIRGL